MSYSHDAPAVLIAALSGRALASAARRSGYAPLVADLFEDDDTRAIAARSIRVPGSLSRGLRRPALLDALERLASGGAPIGITYGSGFENRPSLIEDFARHFPLLGNKGATVKRVKDPMALAAMCRKLGIAHPESRSEAPATAGWLRKTRGGSGGAHVRAARHSGSPSRRDYWQRQVEGTAVSALFLADGQRCVVLGFTEQWPNPAPDRPFRYGGAVRPVAMNGEQLAGLQNAVTSLVADTGLLGLNSADFMLRPSGFDLIEINPRPGATLDVFPSKDLFRLHVEACRGALPPSVPAFNGAAAACVVYAPRELCLPHDFAWPVWTADRQRSGERVQRGAPVCTVLADAETADAARALVCSRAEQMMTRFAG